MYRPSSTSIHARVGYRSGMRGTALPGSGRPPEVPRDHSLGLAPERDTLGSLCNRFDMPVTSATNLESLRLLADADEATLEFRLGVDACFHSSSRLVRLAWSGGAATLQRGVDEETLASVTISIEHARACSNRAVAILLAVADSRSDRSTTHHHGSLRWVASSPNCAGSAEWSTTSLSPEDLAQILGQRPDLASRVPPGQADVAFLLRDLLAELDKLGDEEPAGTR